MLLIIRLMLVVHCLSFGSLLSAHAQLSIKSAASVTPTGAAAYSIPIEVPPGVGGFGPQLSLDYNSQSGNGLLGVGWSLSGLSSIVRCAQTQERDGAAYVRGINFSNQDRLCLNGVRLMLKSGVYWEDGAIYGLEQDDFTQIKQIGATQCKSKFIVQDRSGRHLEYGSSVDSCLRTKDGSVVVSWQLKTVSAVTGGKYVINYFSNSQGESYVENISYGGVGAGVEIRFSYSSPGDLDARPDIISGYRAGERYGISKRLKGLAVYASGELMSSWGISYIVSSRTNRSILSGVERCAGTAGCQKISFNMPFEYIEARPALKISGAVGDPSNTKWLSGDFNGDGFMDLLRLTHAINYSVRVEYFDRKGFAPVFTKDVPVYTFRPSPFSTDCSNFSEYFVGDFTGDGVDDVLNLRNASAGYNQNPQWLTRLSIWRSVGGGNFVVDDFLRPEQIRHPFATCWRYQNGTIYAGRTVPLVLDVNGDGKKDFVTFGNRFESGGQRDSVIRYYKSNGLNMELTFEVPWYPPVDYLTAKYFSGDFDGDGREDVIEVSNSSGKVSPIIYLSRGNYFDRVSNWLTSAINHEGDFGVGDFNGDGLTDLVQGRAGSGVTNYRIYYSTGKSFLPADYASGGGAFVGSLVAADINADGLSDIINLSADGFSFNAEYFDGLVFRKEQTYIKFFQKLLIGNLWGGGLRRCLLSLPRMLIRLRLLWVGVSIGGQFTPM